MCVSLTWLVTLKQSICIESFLYVKDRYWETNYDYNEKKHIFAGTSDIPGLVLRGG